jgi:hypothetical protein
VQPEDPLGKGMNKYFPFIIDSSFEFVGFVPFDDIKIVYPYQLFECIHAHVNAQGASLNAVFYSVD